MKHIFISLYLVLLTSISIAQQQPIQKIMTAQNKFSFCNEGKCLNINLASGPITNAFTYSVKVAKAGSTCYAVTEKDSLPLFIKPGGNVRFYVVEENRKDSLLCDFTGVVKPASFTESYKKAYKGKITAQVPEVYELVNIVFSLTRRGQSDNNIAYKGTSYYEQVEKAFGMHAQHPVVLRIDSLLNKGLYSQLKMDSYAFIFQGDSIVNGGVYDRASWGNENTLLACVPLLESFAKKTKYRTFYKKHMPYYQQIIKQIGTQLKPRQMKQWLEHNFPSTEYASVKVISSPLVSGNQSANWFEDNGFSEVQMHINAPHRGKWAKGLSENVVTGQLSIPAFTELNHAYINPQAEKLSLEAFEDLSKWTAGKFSDSYQNSFSCFTEYLNWALVSLYFFDYYSADDFLVLKNSLEKTMVDHRGFSRFKEFNEELLRLYKEGRKGRPVADLMDPLLTWAAKQ